jgi:hypothetical protein
MCRQSWQFNTKRVRFLLRSHGVSGEVDKRAPLGLPTLDRAAVSGGGGPPCPIVPQVSLFFSNALLTPLLLTKELCTLAFSLVAGQVQRRCRACGRQRRRLGARWMTASKAAAALANDVLRRADGCTYCIRKKYVWKVWRGSRMHLLLESHSEVDSRDQTRRRHTNREEEN